MGLAINKHLGNYDDGQNVMDVQNEGEGKG